MDREELGHSLSLFRRELVIAEREAAEALNRVESLRNIVAGLVSLHRFRVPPTAPALFTLPDEETTAEIEEVVIDGEAPRGREAVRRVLIENRREMKIAEIVETILAKGWMRNVQRPRDAVAATVQRLVHDGEAERVGVGTYRYRLDKLPPQAEPEVPDDEGGEPD